MYVYGWRRFNSRDGYYFVANVMTIYYMLVVDSIIRLFIHGRNLCSLLLLTYLPTNLSHLSHLFVRGVYTERCILEWMFISARTIEMEPCSPCLFVVRVDSGSDFAPKEWCIPKSSSSSSIIS